ncbi:MAG TPA: peptidoglycan DD-metalloendopeptidase family protein [Stellaceae bacterium]|nr:peptidoglycan DD-metalloendopeptidase family protein [Stellaceae bacterium]
MGQIIDRRRGLASAASLSVIAGLLAACSPGPGSPAPVYLRGAAQTAAKPAPPWRDNTIFTVRQGDTVIDIAHDHHVPLGALIAANQLRSPYLIHTGDRMLIPDGGVPPQMAAIPPHPVPSMAPPQTIATLPPPAPTQIAAASPPIPPPAPTQIAAASPPISPPAPTQIAAISPPPAPPLQVAAIPPRTAANPGPPPLPQLPAIPAHPTAPMQAVTAQLVPAAPPQVAAATPPPPSPMSAKVTPDVVPLDPPLKQLAAIEPPSPPPPAVAPPTKTTNGGPPSVLAARNPAAALPLPGEPVPTVAMGTANGRFLWPVHGRILASYGLANAGAHNEGINIAAPLGTPVRTIDAGTVAYVGNEVKGYGNLVLVKHANGWISAYTNLTDVTVNKGDTVSAGEVIAKVGNTGGVGEPQLHFELRRGKKPVDPKEFLEPAGSAAAKAAQKAG